MIEAARAWAARLRAAHPEIVRIGYFGSYATDNYVPGSDFDVLIEVTQSPTRRRMDRVDAYRPDTFPVGVELFVYTSEELGLARQDGSAFVGEIDRQIIWLEQAGE